MERLQTYLFRDQEAKLFLLGIDLAQEPKPVTVLSPPNHGGLLGLSRVAISLEVAWIGNKFVKNTKVCS
jgi:hypothetical protein